VNLANEPQRKRKTPFGATKTVLHCGDVIGDFLDVIDGNAGHCFVANDEHVALRRGVATTYVE
jgi:hypothetical protein